MDDWDYATYLLSQKKLGYWVNMTNLFYAELESIMYS